MKTSIEDLLKQHGLSLTKNRSEILSALLDNHHFHSASDIQKELPEMNTKSIYNNLKAMINNGLVEEISVKGVVMYAIVDSTYHNHPVAHVIKDGKIDHLNLSNKSIALINKEARAKGIIPKNIKIFIEE